EYEKLLGKNLTDKVDEFRGISEKMLDVEQAYNIPVHHLDEGTPDLWGAVDARTGLPSDQYSKGYFPRVMTPFGRELREKGGQIEAVDPLTGKPSLDAGYAFLISENGSFISHPNTELNGQPTTNYFGTEFKQDLKFQQLTINGQSLLIKLVKVPNINWYLGVALESDIISSTASTLRNQAIFYSLIALFFGVFVMVISIGKLMAPLEQLGAAMTDISSGDGDLTQRLATDGDQEFSMLAQGFNEFVSKLQQLISDSKKLSQQINLGTEEAVEGAQSSSTAMSQQLAELEQLAAAMTEMSSTSLEVSGYAQQAAQFAESADQAAKEGADIVNQTSNSIIQLSTYIENAVNEVKQLEDSTSNIETILSVISGIADQTNLLALNAAIEAARAGEQGRGFAVVADEVRNLAQRTQESTAEIKSMIEILQQSSHSVATVMAQSQDEATMSVEKANLANQSLESISGAIGKITEMNFQIATAAEEQSLVAEEINENTINIKGFSQDVHDSAKVTNEAMSQQQLITQQQQEVLGRFIV
ncbi:MAG: methyl-accepting chemotaxis protein, partial [Gammaproteobacteria bacterium]|nr:methyl-accepting chemotaxis protein [Gammaproteobacteria bacterium]